MIKLIFCCPCISTVKINAIHFVFSLLRVNGLYMFRPYLLIIRRRFTSGSWYINNNNNNNIYLLQMGFHPVAVIALHVFPITDNKFS
jgi:hypothetical protein